MEENKKGNSFLVTFFAALLVGALGIVIGYNINSKTTNTSKKSCDSEEKLEKASKDSYSFDFYDGTIPGRHYKGNIDLKTGEAKVTILGSCSALDCKDVEPDEYEGKLTTKDLNKLIKYLEDKKYPSVTEIKNEEDKVVLNIADYIKNKIEANDNNEIADDKLK